MKIDEKILNSIFNSLEEFIVVVDLNGKILMMSDIYKRFLNCDNPEGKYVEDVIPNTRLHLIAKDGVKEIGEIQEVNNHKMISMRVPLVKDGKIVGAIGKIMFKDLSNFKLLNKKISKLEKEIEYYKNELEDGKKAKYTFKNLIGESDRIKELVQFAKKIARGDSNILITGESGTGKELMAQSIHNGSKRCFGPFVKVNCGAIPLELFESEMFGYEEGAFTGAKKSGKKGLFEYANGGTILLDEIGDMPLSMQVKLLRVIQEREILRIGGNEQREIDVRVIASTNKNLADLVHQGKFREDLYYRLNVININLPPLRERPEDIEVLSNKLINNLCGKYHIYSEGISKDALEYLRNYSWPGNVRQLENVLERAINLLDGEIIIQPKHLPEKILEFRGKKYSIEKGTLKVIVEEIEKKLIVEALEKFNGNKNKAANCLGLSRAGLYKKIDRYHLEDY